MRERSKDFVLVIVSLTIAVALATGAARGDYISIVTSNTTTGTATFNASLSGNATWTLRHVASGSTPAGQTVTLTSAPGLIALYSGAYGNLTGNFTFTVKVNVTVGTFNNTTIVHVEEKSSQFEVAPPPAPTPTPTPAPAPSVGTLSVRLLAPDPDRTHTETLRVEAWVVPSGNNTTVKEVVIAKERADPKPERCAGVAAGWKIAVLSDSAKGVWVASWLINNTEDPAASLPAGLYTIYVNATANDGAWACNVASGIRVKQAAAIENKTPVKEDGTPVNLSIIGATCRAGPPPEPCQSGVSGPPIVDEVFTFQLNVPAPVAVCSGTCQRSDKAERHSFKAKAAGERWCVRSIDPKTDAIAEEVKCWTAGGASAHSGLAPGLERPIGDDPANIPCKTDNGLKVGQIIQNTYQDSGGANTVVSKIWNVVPGVWATVKCSAVEKVHWRITHPRCETSNRTGQTGIQLSRARDADGIYTGPSTPTDLFTVAVPCPGTYTIQTMSARRDPEKDPWATFAEVEVLPPGGFNWLDWILLSAVAGFGFAAFALLMRSRPETYYYWYSGDLTEPPIPVPHHRNFFPVSVFNSQHIRNDKGKPQGVVVQRNGYLTSKFSGKLPRHVHYRIFLAKDFNKGVHILKRFFHGRYPLLRDIVTYGPEQQRMTWEPQDRNLMSRTYEVLSQTEAERQGLWKDLRSVVKGEQMKRFDAADAEQDAQGLGYEGAEAAQARQTDAVLRKEDIDYRAALRVGKGEGPSP